MQLRTFTNHDAEALGKQVSLEVDAIRNVSRSMYTFVGGAKLPAGSLWGA